MKIHMCDPRSPWACEVHLNSREWPPIDIENESWYQRPIRMWVTQHCGNHIFSPQGWIMFQRMHDAVQFQLSWSQ